MKSPVRPGCVMPEQVHLGRQMSSTMYQPIFHAKQDDTPNVAGLRKVMGYFIPPWQRGLVWTIQQNIAFLESAWLGLNLGTYTFNQTRRHHPLDNILIDGQQRLHAIQCYLQCQFQVFGYRWDQVTAIDRRRFENNTHFHSYITDSTNERYLRSYYDMTNFGGVAHKESERAIVPERDIEVRSEKPKWT